MNVQKIDNSYTISTNHPFCYHADFQEKFLLILTFSSCHFLLQKMRASQIEPRLEKLSK